MDMKQRYKDEIEEIKNHGASPVKVKCGDFYTIASVVRLLNSMKEQINEIKKTEAE